MENNNIIYRVIHTEKDINQRVDEIAKQISELARPNDIFICLLRGGLFFYSDLMKRLCFYNFNGVKLHFLDVKTIVDDNGDKHADVFGAILDGNTSGILKQVLNGANIWIVDEIMDSGRSVSAVIDWMEALYKNSDIIKSSNPHIQPKYNIIMMIERVGAKHDPRVENKVVGFLENRKDWFVGYGMDGTCGKLRAMPAIAIEIND